MTKNENVGKIEINESSADSVRKDISWPWFLIWYLAAAIINGVVHQYRAPIDAPNTAELVLFYAGFVLADFLIPSLFVIPLHFIGKKFTTGYDAPRKLILFWAALLWAMNLLIFLFRS